jgi:multiple sugar transport system substrate-binding protein
MEALQQKHSPVQGLFVPGHIWLPELADAGQLAEITPLMKALPSSVITTYDPEDIVPEIASECCYRGAQYQLPFFSDGHLLFYRRDLLSFDTDNGVPIVSTKTIPKLAQNIHSPPHTYGIALKADVSEIFTDFLPYLWENGGEILDAEGQPNFDHPANIEALERYCSLKEFCPPKTEHYGNEAIEQSLRNGEAALVANWGGQTAPIMLDPENAWRDQYRTALFPIPWNATWGIAIPANQSKALQQSMLEALLQLLQPTLDKQITRAAGSPVRTSSYAQDQIEQYPWLSAQREMLRRARLLPDHPKLGSCLGSLYEAVHQAFTRDTSAQEALQSLQHQCTKSWHTS